MKLDQSVCPPPVEDRVLVVVPDDFNKYGKLNLYWVLLKMTNHWHCEKLAIVCFHYEKHISRKKLDKELRECVSICNESKVSCDTLVLRGTTQDDEADTLKKLIRSRGFTKLVMPIMPGAADKHYSEEMKSPESETVRTLMKKPPSTCKIWFICNGNLICTREANTAVHAIKAQPMDSSALQIAKQMKDNDQHFLHKVNQCICDSEERRKKCACGIKYLEGNIASHTKAGPSRRLGKDLGEAKQMKDNDQHFLHKVNQCICDSEERRKECACGIKYLEGNIASHTKGGPSRRLGKDLGELGKEARERPTMHREAEPSITSVLEMVKNDYQRRLRDATSKKSHLETRLKKLAKHPGIGSSKREAERKVTEKCYQLELKNAQKDKSRLEKEIVKVESLEKIARNKYFPQDPEAAVTEAGGLGEKNDQQSAMTLPAETVNTDLSKDVIEEAKKCLGDTLIGEGGSGSVYKGLLHNTTLVAIKMMHRESMQGESDFNRKVAVLGRVRHPNLVTLMGVCREVFGLVYEFLPNGSLQDQLVACRNGMSSPLRWQVRINIIREIWTVLTFLHSSKPPLVHGNLKPSKVLLDSNFTCKLEASAGIFQSIGTPTATEDDDMHSFGTIALQLLMTWLSSEKDDVVKVVDEANKKGELDTVLKTTAGDWPTELAKRLAHIGLRCVGMSGGLESPAEAPPDDLAEEVRKLFVAADRFAAASQDEAEAQAPDHFRCPISNVLMVDPHIAADGHTYELKDINTWWFSYGKNTSPVTREVIADKRLILNRAIKLMIENWKEEQQRQVRTTLIVCDPNPVQSSLQGHPTIPPAAQSQPPTGLHPDPVTSRSLTPLDTSAEAQLQLQPPPASSSPPTTLISSTTDARSRSTAPLNTSAASARSHRLNPLPANPSAAAPPPPRPVSLSSTDFLPPPTGIRRRRVNGRLPSSSTEPDVPAGPGETSIIREKLKHQ